MSFLTAEWRKLILANYAIDKDILEKYVPFKTELDIWEGKCYVSMVGFQFKKVRLLGVPIPFHTDFEEVNLRFYVRYKEGGEWKRGVVFIKEIVPKMAITFVANNLYQEPYVTMPMRHTWEQEAGKLNVEYAWQCKDNWQKMRVETNGKLQQIEEGSEAEFITEHYWGYTKKNDTTTYEYQVTHPRWEQYAVEKYDINIDFALNYGKNFSFLTQIAPNSVMLAEGSKITVEQKRTLY
jgi:uncharacterized protein